MQPTCDLYEVMNLTGHKSLGMVQRYSHLAPNFQENANRVLDRQQDTRFGHNSGTVTPCDKYGKSPNPLKEMVPMRGLEPRTYALRMRCSTN